MSQITWQNVAVPQFDVGANYGRAGELLTGALNNLGAGANVLDQARTDQIAANMRAALSTAGSADDAQKMIQSGKIAGYDLADPEIAKRINPADLLDQVAGRIKSEQGLQSFDQHNALDANAAAVRDMLANSASLDPQAQEKSRQQYASLSASLGADNLMKLMGDAQRTQTGALTNRDTQFAGDVTQRNDAIDTTARNIWESVRPLGGTPEEMAYALREKLRPLEGKENFGRIAAAAEQYAGLSPGSLGGSAGTGMPGAAGGPGALGGGSGAGMGSAALGLVTGGKQLDPTIKTVGDFTNPGNRSTILGANGGNSAMGVYQTTIDTWKQFAPKALGDGWQNADIRDFNVQDKVGNAIFDWAKQQSDPVAALQGRWASLSKDQASKLAGQDWNTARQVIAQGESGASPAQVQGQAVAANAASHIEAAQQDPNNIAANMLAASDKRDLPGTIQQMVTDYKMAPSDASNAITMIQDRAKALKGPGYPNGINLTPGQALEIFKVSRRGEGIGDYLGGWAFADNRAGDKFRTRNDLIDQNIQTYASPQALQQVVRDSIRSQKETVNAGNLQGFNAAYQNYVRAYTLAQNNEDYAKSGLVDRAKQQMLQAGRIAGVGTGDLANFVNPQYFGDPSLISKLRVGNDSNTRPASTEAPVAANKAPQILASAAPKPVVDNRPLIQQMQSYRPLRPSQQGSALNRPLLASLLGG